MMKLATEINMDRFHQSFLNMIQWHSQPASLHMKPWVLLWGFINFLSFDDASQILAIFGSDNGLAPYRRQAIIWTNDDLLSIMHLWMNTTEIYTILTLKRKCINIWVDFFSFKSDAVCNGLKFPSTFPCWISKRPRWSLMELESSKLYSMAVLELELQCGENSAALSSSKMWGALISRDTQGSVHYVCKWWCLEFLKSPCLETV